MLRDRAGRAGSSVAGTDAKLYGEADDEVAEGEGDSGRGAT